MNSSIFNILRIIFALAFLGGGLWQGIKAVQGYGLSDLYITSFRIHHHIHQVKNPWVSPNKATKIARIYLWAYVLVITIIGLVFLFIQ